MCSLTEMGPAAILAVGAFLVLLLFLAVASIFDKGPRGGPFG